MAGFPVRSPPGAGPGAGYPRGDAAGTRVPPTVSAQGCRGRQRGCGIPRAPRLHISKIPGFPLPRGHQLERVRAQRGTQHPWHRAVRMPQGPQPPGNFAAHEMGPPWASLPTRGAAGLPVTHRPPSPSPHVAAFPNPCSISISPLPKPRGEKKPAPQQGLWQLPPGTPGRRQQAWGKCRHFNASPFPADPRAGSAAPRWAVATGAHRGHPLPGR